MLKLLQWLVNAQLKRRLRLPSVVKTVTNV